MYIKSGEISVRSTRIRLKILGAPARRLWPPLYGYIGTKFWPGDFNSEFDPIPVSRTQDEYL